MNINFNAQHKKKKKTPIIISITWKPNNRIQKSIGISVETKYWKGNKQILDSKHPNAVNFNSYLAKLREQINKRVFSEVKSEEDLTKYMLADIIEDILSDGIRKEARKLNVIEVFDIFLEKYRIDGLKPKEKTKQGYKTCRNKIELLQEELRTEFQFKDLNEDFYHKFIDFQFELGNKRPTIGANITKLKAFLEWTLERKYHNNTKFRSYKVYRDEGQFKIALTSEEIERLKSYEPLNENIEFVRLFMLVNIALGLRASDLIDIIKNRDLGSKSNQEKNTTLKIIQIKTGINQELSIPADVLEMIKRLQSMFNKKHTVFFINKYLRRLGKEIELNEIETATYPLNNTRITEKKYRYELFTTHVGRRTFATRAMRNGVPIHVIMKFTGHKRLESFQKYIDPSSFIYKDVIGEIWKS